MDRMLLYDLIYALAARDGREAELFGTCAPLAHEACSRSMPADAFPELWFELPLTGDPWFDVHALTAREDVKPGMVFAPESCGGHTGAFEWFAAQGEGVRQLALSWDVSSGNIDEPAVQLLVWRDGSELMSGFLEAVDRKDAVPACKAFTERMPEGWFACYVGTFPGRPDHNLRVECIPERGLQKAYAADASLLSRHLEQVGYGVRGGSGESSDVGGAGVRGRAGSANGQDGFGELVARCCELANTPFQLEFQFDVEPDGAVGNTFGASLRFAAPSAVNSEDAWQTFVPDGAAGELMQRIVNWGLADDRWRLLGDTTFAQRASFGAESCTLYCFPAFVKLRWRSAEPLDAKAYLMAGIQVR